MNFTESQTETIKKLLKKLENFSIGDAGTKQLIDLGIIDNDDDREFTELGNNFCDKHGLMQY